MNPEDDKVIWDRKLFWKILKWTAIAVFIWWLVFGALGKYGPDIERYFQRRALESENKKLIEQAKKFDELAKSDTYGGKTPEETLDLYIDALKKGDIELAAKYSRVDQQESRLLSLQNLIKERGEFKFPIWFVTELKERGKKMCKEDWCIFDYERMVEEETVYEFKNGDNKLVIPKGGIDYMSITLKINKYTGVWKIVEP